MITFLELRIQKKSEKQPEKWTWNPDPVLVPLSVGIFPESSENGRILGAAFWSSKSKLLERKHRIFMSGFGEDDQLHSMKLTGGRFRCERLDRSLLANRLAELLD